MVIGPGLPRMDAEQELICAVTDVGVIALIGKRFSYANYPALSPPHWYFV